MISVIGQPGIVNGHKDQSGSILYYSEVPGSEPRYFTVARALNAGKTSSLSGWIGSGAADPAVDHAEIALSHLRFSDGSVLELSDADDACYPTETGSYLDAHDGTAVNAYPGDALLEAERSFLLGLTEMSLHARDAEHYGYHSGGKYVLEVVPGSLSDQAGLRPGDLIVAVDGKRWTDDRYIIERGKAAMAEGDAVTFTVERPGLEGT